MKERGKRGWLARGLIAIAITVLVIILIIALIVGGFLLWDHHKHAEFDKYNGHGFRYMYGFSSTDFTGYHVYDGEKLVELDHPASLTIEGIKNMPVLDGAEACYPIYTAVAKAIYKDIDIIESEVFDLIKEAEKKEWGLEYDHIFSWKYNNGRVVRFTNSVEGYGALIEHDVDLFFGARPSANQKEMATIYNEQIISQPIGREAFVFFVEEDNPVENLTSEEVRKIYSGEITNWKEVGGKNQKIIAFQRPEDSGSQVMMKYFMGEVPLMEPDTITMVNAMGGVIENVKQYHNEAGAIGYTFRYFLEGLNQEKGVKMLSVDGVYPSVENIKTGAYPVLASLVCAGLASNDSPYVQQVLDFLLSDDGQKIIEETGYGPLPRDSEGKVQSEPIIENEIEEGRKFMLVKDSVRAEIVLTEHAFELTYGDIFTRGTYSQNYENQGYRFYPIGERIRENGIESIDFRIDSEDGQDKIIILDINVWPEHIRDEEGIPLGYTEADIDYGKLPQKGDTFVTVP
ncbi:MAG: substrate-binding domain-containing protein [Firmicutes bacterium]|nr:substrate-binding domain-containing protein [Bacillota bacterium]